MPRTVHLITLLAILHLSSLSLAYGQTINTDAWLEDFAQLKREMSAHYANLEWTIEHRGLNLKQLSEYPETRLRQARSDSEAQEIIESFLAAFGDGHLNVQWAQNAGNASPSPAGSQPAQRPDLCERLGYQSQDASTRHVFSRLSSFRELETEDSKYFPIGVLRISNTKSVGVLRIALL